MCNPFVSVIGEANRKTPAGLSIASPFRSKKGKCWALSAPIDRGKTSLLKVLAKVISPQEGNAHLFGKDLKVMPQREVARLIGVVPQDTQQLFPFTVAETVLMGRFPHRAHDRWSEGIGWENQEDLAVAQQAMATMDIAHLARRSVTDLSGGERQRTVIARALTQARKLYCSTSQQPFSTFNIRSTSVRCCVG